jgi:protein TonB
LPAPVIEPQPAVNQALETAQHIEEHSAPPAHADAPVDKPDLARVSLENERESYLQRMLAHIDNHKFYPRSARRRGMEGEIRVSFHLHRDGGISDLQVSGGSKVLRKAAKQAVQQALSLPPPPASMPPPEKIRFGMVYRLDMQAATTTRKTGRE